MPTIIIQDLDCSKDLDRQALASVTGGISYGWTGGFDFWGASRRRGYGLSGGRIPNFRRIGLRRTLLWVDSYIGNIRSNPIYWR